MKHRVIGELRAGEPEKQQDSGVTTTHIGLLNPRYDVMRGLQNLCQLGLQPTELGVDIMVLAALVHAADTRISRQKDAQDSWTREIHLLVPVQDPGLWTGAVSVLNDMLKFLTGDRWTVEFHARPPEHHRLAPTVREGVEVPGPSHLALFSGGLDSLIDAINVLEAGGTPLLVSHAGDGATSKAQEQVEEALKGLYPGREMHRLRVWLSYPKKLISGSEFTTRARSFLFFSMGVVAGLARGRPFSLRVPENGLIALNVPLDPLRLGALSTRTTHPYYMARWNELLGVLGVEGELVNPYWDQTKGEMVQQCHNADVLKGVVGLSLSCSSPSKGRYRKLPTGHCGHCLPCLIRRAALLKGWGEGEDPTVYFEPDLALRPLSTTRAEGKQVRSFQFALHQLKQKPELARGWIHKPGPLGDVPHQLPALEGVYWRGMLEVDTLLQHVSTQPD